MIKNFNHVAIAVKNLDEAIKLFESLLELKVKKIEALPEQGVRAAIFSLGNANIELIQPLAPTSGVAKFIEKRGEGLHHISLTVEDVNGALNYLEQKGAELIDRKGRKGLEGRVGFVHPKTFKGVLLELIQVEDKT